jgi:hypothetical protein
MAEASGGPASYPPSLRSAVDNLISYLRRGAGSRSSRGDLGDTPPRRAPGAGGRGAPEPFASCFRGDCSPLIARSPVRAAAAPAGPRVVCGAGERERSAAAEHEGVRAPFFVESRVESRFARRKLLAAATPRLFGYALCCQGSHPRAPPLLRPRSSRRTRVGRA